MSLSILTWITPNLLHASSNQTLITISCQATYELFNKQKREWTQKTNVVSTRHLSVARRDEHLDWLRALAEQGLASAQLLLAQMHSAGRGLSLDRAQTYRLSLSAERPSQLLEISRRRRKKLAGEMRPMEIAEAERRAARVERRGRTQPQPRAPSPRGAVVSVPNPSNSPFATPLPRRQRWLATGRVRQ